MIDRDIAIRHMTLLDAESVEDYDSMIRHWEKHFDSMLNSEHSGDCTKNNWTCSRCVVEEAMAMVPIYRKAFGV